MGAQSSVATAPSDRVLVITRTFDAPRPLVFKAWTEPEHMSRWFGPKDFNVVSCAMDVRTGGNFRIHSRSPGGSNHYLQGVYREIVPPERLVSTYCWSDSEWKPSRPETILTLTFEEEQNRTKLTLHQAVFESVTACDMHRHGWTESFDDFARYLAEIR